MSHANALRAMLLVAAGLGFVMGICATRIMQLMQTPIRDCRPAVVLMQDGEWT